MEQLIIIAVLVVAAINVFWSIYNYDTSMRLKAEKELLEIGWQAWYKVADKLRESKHDPR